MGHTYSNILFHVISATKDRAPVITPEIRPQLDAYIGGIVRGHRGVLLAAGGVLDHSHWLVSAHQDTAPSVLVRDMKADSTNWMRKTVGMKRFEWQPGYGIFSVSKSVEERLRTYIRNQEKHHEKMTYMEELAILLKRNGVPFDPRYLAD